MQLLSNSKADCRDPRESWRVNKALAHFPSSALGTHRAELGQECPRTGDCTITLRLFFFFSQALHPAVSCLQGWQGCSEVEEEQGC